MKQFLVIGNFNYTTRKGFLQYIKDGEIGMGVTPRKGKFIQPDGSIKDVNSVWYTNMSHKDEKKPLLLTKTYDPDKYPKYDNADAIECSKTADIPMDYDGVIGVPLTFLDKYCPEQFEIIKVRKGADGKDLSVGGKSTYFRLLIKKRA